MSYTIYTSVLVKEAPAYGGLFLFFCLVALSSEVKSMLIKCKKKVCVTWGLIYSRLEKIVPIPFTATYRTCRSSFCFSCKTSTATFGACSISLHARPVVLHLWVRMQKEGVAKNKMGPLISLEMYYIIRELMQHCMISVLKRGVLKIKIN